MSKYVAHYRFWLQKRPPEKVPEYYQTIYADTLDEAIKEAEKWRRKNYMFTGCKKEEV